MQRIATVPKGATIEAGENPDLEIGRFLSEKARFPYIARIGGWLEYQSQHRKAATQAILQEFVPNQGDAWRYSLRILTAFYESIGDTPGPELSASQEPAEFRGDAMAQLLTKQSWPADLNLDELREDRFEPGNLVIEKMYV